MTRRILAAFALLVLASLACNTLLGEEGDQVDGGGISPPEGTSLEETPEGGEEPSGTVLLEDDFSDPSSGWDVGDFDTGSVGYQLDAYEVVSTGGGATVWGQVHRQFSDVIIEVEAEQVSAPSNDNNDYGVMCRVQENSDGYFLLISGDGMYAILKRADGEYVRLVEWSAADAIQRGNAANHIRASCLGSGLSLEVNGEQLATANDTSFSSGDLALTATSYEEEGTTVHFDDFVVLEP